MDLSAGMRFHTGDSGPNDFTSILGEISCIFLAHQRETCYSYLRLRKRNWDHEVTFEISDSGDGGTNRRGPYDFSSEYLTSFIVTERLVRSEEHSVFSRSCPTCLCGADRPSTPPHRDYRD